MVAPSDESTAPLRFGANYTPSRDWMYSWFSLNFDDVRRDFEAIAAIGLDHVRIFPLWPVMQPNRALIRKDALDDVRRVVDIAAEYDLDAGVDVIQGHLSSFDYLPAWLTTWHRRNMFTDPDVVAAQVDLVRSVGGVLTDAPNFLGLTLGNELNQFADAPHPSPWPITAGEAERWLTTLLDAANDVAPNANHLHSEYDAVWYLDGHPFTPAHATRIGGMTTVHSWVFNGTAQRYGGRSTASERHAEYLVELSRAFATDPARPIWLQEVGAPANFITPEDAPDFLEATIRSVARSADLWGVTWWCSHDVHRKFADFPELEYSLGLIDVTGMTKPIGRRFAEVAGELRAARPVPVTRDTAIMIDVDDADTPTDRTALSPGGGVFQRWVELCDAGVDPTFVTSTIAADPAALARRGISHIVSPACSALGLARYAAVNTTVTE